jgi:Flp pilus assembly protein TadD
MRARRDNYHHGLRAGTYVNRGIMLDTLGQTDQAAEDYKAAIALDPALGDT